MEPIELTTVSTPDDVRDILELQARNLPSASQPNFIRLSKNATREGVKRRLPFERGQRAV